MKHATMFAALLFTFAVPAGTAGAQEWGGVAGIAAMRGYSASPGMPSVVSRPIVPPQATQEVSAAGTASADRYVATAPRRTEVRAGAVVRSTAQQRQFARQVFERPTLLARTKRPGLRRRARAA